MKQLKIPPGWYPDHRDPGQRRYWDGEHWLQLSEEDAALVPTAPTRRLPRKVLLPVLAATLVVAAVGGKAWSAGSTSTGERPIVDARATSTATASPKAAPRRDRSAAKVVPTTEAFKTDTRDGVGDAVIPVPRPDGANRPVLVAATHQGKAAFVLQAGGDLLVNEVGAYAGTTLLTDPAATKLSIVADGPWHVEFRSAYYATQFDPRRPISGKGDAVLLYSGPLSRAEISHRGDGEFMVEEIVGSDVPRLLVNGIGKYVWRVPFSGPSLIVVTAEGPWTITVT